VVAFGRIFFGHFMSSSGHAHSCVGGCFPEKDFHRMVFSGKTFHIIINEQVNGRIFHAMTVNLEDVVTKQLLNKENI